MRLSEARLASLPAGITQFGYDRSAQKIGIVHFGIGAFHRAHQAWYTDAAMNAGDRDWMIAGVSLRSGDVAAQMNPQDGLFTLTERSAGMASVRLIGSVREVLVAAQDRARVIALLAEPATQIASFTITEKGYGRASDGSLDPALAGTGTIYPLLAEGLRRRREAGQGGLTLLSCDNLANNGGQLACLMEQYCDLYEPGLGKWIAAHCAFPSTMIDRIVPATTLEDRAEAEAALGARDEAAVFTEPFNQWVIEDHFAGLRPRWEAVGAQLVTDVAPFETAKLRMLNGAHSALAYLGIERGHTFVHQAIVDAEIRPVVEQLIRREAATSMTPAPGQSLERYADALLARFANPAMQHRLIQIAMDGSQKIPQRWLETLAHHQQEGRECPAIMTSLRAWLRHVRGDNVAIHGPVDDPLAGVLKEAWDHTDEGGIFAALFGPDGLIPSPWQPPTRYA